ncbi:MAG: hypothetical protein HKO62_02675 [Gammaproteobacteria bacterium]|nr:hypothetical protein [Gammaproteobacteria bacterium]
MVVETGNYKSANRVLSTKAHWIFQLDHRWYFSPDTMRCLLEDAGYTETILCDRLLRPDWNGRTDYAGPSLPGLVKSVAMSPTKIASHLARFARLRRIREWELAGIGIFAIAARRG